MVGELLIFCTCSQFSMIKEWMVLYFAERRGWTSWEGSGVAETSSWWDILSCLCINIIMSGSLLYIMAVVSHPSCGILDRQRTGSVAFSYLCYLYQLSGIAVPHCLLTTPSCVCFKQAILPTLMIYLCVGYKVATENRLSDVLRYEFILKFFAWKAM